MTMTRKMTGRYSKPAKGAGVITQRMLYERKREPEFRAAFSKRGWVVKEATLKQFFNKYCKDIGFRVALNRYFIKKETAINTLMRAIKQTVGMPFVLKILLVGKEGTGKSTIGRKLARVFASCNHAIAAFTTLSGETMEVADGDFDAIKRILCTYNINQTRVGVAREDAPDSTVFQDEMPAMRGKNSRNTAHDLENILKVAARASKINFIFVNPTPILVFDFDFVIEVLGANYQRKQTLAMLYYISGGQMVADGVVIFDVSEPSTLTTWYEVMALKNKDDLREDGGSSTVTWETAAEDVALVLDAIEASGESFTRKADLKAFIADPGASPTLGRVRASMFLGEITDRVYSKLGSSSKDAPGAVDYELDYDSEFKVSEEELLKAYPSPRDAAIYLKYQDPRVKQDDVAAEFNIDQSTVSRIAGTRGEVTGWIAEQIGLLYEQYLTEKLRREHPDAVVIHDGRKGKSDIRMDEGNTTTFFSVKCYNTTRKTVSVPIDELGPEIKDTRALREQFPDRVVKCIFHLHNRADGAVVEREVDVKRLPNSLLLKLKK